MVHITISRRYKDHELDVQPTDIVDPILEKYSENHDDPGESPHCEPTFIIGKDIPLNEGETFAECGIGHEDVLHLLLRLEKYILFRSDFSREEITIVRPISLCGTVGNLIETLRGDPENRVTNVPRQLLSLRLGDEILDQSKTLDEYNIKNNDVIHLCSNFSTNISIRMLVYANIEQVLFKPEDTLADVKREVQRMMPGFQCTENIRETYPVKLRSIVCENGTTFFVYWDLFRRKMYVFVTEYKEDGENEILAHSLNKRTTLDGIRRVIRMRRNLYVAPHLEKWPPKYIFDRLWTQTFASRIKPVPLSSTSIPLFFFPLCTQLLRSVEVGSTTTATEVAASSCEEELGLEGAQRSIYHPRSDTFFVGYICKYYRQLGSGGESHSVTLTKPCYRRISRKKDIITIRVRWQAGTALSVVQFKVRTTDTINILQDAIESVIQVPFYLQKLMFRGKPIQSNSTFIGLGIGDCSILDLLPSEDFEILKFLLQ